MSNNINNNDWTQALRQKANQATREVPQGTWEAIAGKMPQQAQPAPQRGRIAPRMWKAVAAAACVAIVATTGYFAINNDDRQPVPNSQLAQVNQPAATQQSSPEQPAQEPGQEQTTPATATPQLAQQVISRESSLSHQNRAPRRKAVSREPSPSDYENQQQEFENGDEQYFANLEEEYTFNPDEYFYDIETMQALEELQADYDNAMNQEAMEPWRSYSDSTYHQHLAYDANARRIAREQMALPRSKTKPELLMAAYGNGLISTDRNTTATGSATQGNAMLAPAAPGVTPRVAPPVNYNYHHHMPLTFGLTFTKRIVGNLYGNVGLNFTSMNSDVTPDNGEAEFKQNIKLIGLPFGVRWNFWRYKGLTTFVGCEGLVERVVDASFGNEDVTIKRLQWSVHATAGLQYNFTKHVGIYIEPKLSHYITTLPLNTQRNEHPFNFNLQMGLSLDF